MRSKENLCPVTGAQCYDPYCTADKCSFQDPDEVRESRVENETFIDNSGIFPLPPGVSPKNVITEPTSEPAIEGRVENLEKATTDIYWQIKQLKEKWEGKKDEQ